MTQTDPKSLRADREAFQSASADTMKAIVYTHYGSPDVLQFKEVTKPTPKDDEVLIKVYAAGANAADWHLLVRLAHGLRNEVAPWRESAPQPVNERMKWR